MKRTSSIILLFIVLLIAGLFGCNKDSNPESIEPERTTYLPFEAAQINTSGITPENPTYTGTINGSSVTLTNTNGSLTFLMPDIPAGDYTLITTIDGKEYTIPVKVSGHSAIADPLAVFNTEVTELAQQLSEVQDALDNLSPADKATMQGDINTIKDWTDSLQAKYATLSDEQKLECAKALLANKWWIDEIKNASADFITSTAALRKNGFVDDFEASVNQAVVGYLKPLVKVCTKNIPKVVSIVGSGALVGIAVGAAPLGAAIGLGVAMGKLLIEVNKITIAEEKLLTICFRPFQNLFADNQRIATLQYEKNVEKELKITMDYHSPYKNDRSDAIPIENEMIKTQDEFKSDIQLLNTKLPQPLNYLPPTVDKKLSYTTQNRDVHSNYITISNISNNKVTVSTRKQDGVVFVTFNTTETTDQTFTYKVNYNTPDFGTQSYTVSAELKSGNTVTDIDGNVYQTVTIGTQVWMKENLKTTRYKDGTAIPNVTDNMQWDNLSSGAYCIYDNNAANNTTYGKLYNWYAVNTGKLAPAGWHVPTDAEWTTLTDYLGGDDIAGDKMRDTTFTLWEYYDGFTSTNSSGFTALPAGFRNSSSAGSSSYAGLF